VILSRFLFKWASSREPLTGLKQFYAAMMLEKAGLYSAGGESLLCRRRSFSEGLRQHVLEDPLVQSDRRRSTAVDYLTRTHPELGMQHIGGRIRIRNHFDDDPATTFLKSTRARGRRPTECRAARARGS